MILFLVEFLHSFVIPFYMAAVTFVVDAHSTPGCPLLVTCLFNSSLTPSFFGSNSDLSIALINIVALQK